MDYHNKYLRYKTKYINLKYYNNQYGGENEFICLPDSEGRYSTYDKCKRKVTFDESKSSNLVIDTTPFMPIRGAFTSMSELWDLYKKDFVKLGKCVYCNDPVFQVDKNMSTNPYYATVFDYRGGTYSNNRYNSIVVIHSKCIQPWHNKITSGDASAKSHPK